MSHLLESSEEGVRGAHCSVHMHTRVRTPPQAPTSLWGFLASEVPAWLCCERFLRGPFPHTSFPCCSLLTARWELHISYSSCRAQPCPSPSARTCPIQCVMAPHLQLETFDVSRLCSPEGHPSALQLPIPLLDTNALSCTRSVTQPL